MKFCRSYIVQPVYGLMVYFTIRLLMDSISGTKFWKRDWQLNGLEIVSSMVVGYLVLAIFNRLFKWFDTRWETYLSYGRIAKEFGYLFIVNLVLQNAILTPFAALTDNGLQWGDLIAINTIPLLYAFIYYGVKRSNTFLQAYIDGKLQLEKVTNNQLLSELKFLRAQYHPHFLFNALNTIYFQMDEDIESAKKTVEEFSELLRYQLYDQQKKVSVNREIQYLENYIALQKLRMSDKLSLACSFDSTLNAEQVYPLLFLPLVENAFKYVGGDFEMKLELKKQGDTLLFTIENSTPQPAILKKSGGIGLENLKRRLELLYPAKHQFKTTIKHDRFIANLKILLN